MYGPDTGSGSKPSPDSANIEGQEKQPVSVLVQVCMERLEASVRPPQPTARESIDPDFWVERLSEKIDEAKRNEAAKGK